MAAQQGKPDSHEQMPPFLQYVLDEQKQTNKALFDYLDEIRRELTGLKLCFERRVATLDRDCPEHQGRLEKLEKKTEDIDKRWSPGAIAGTTATICLMAFSVIGAAFWFLFTPIQKPHNQEGGKQYVSSRISGDGVVGDKVGKSDIQGV